MDNCGLLQRALPVYWAHHTAQEGGQNILHKAELLKWEALPNLLVRQFYSSERRTKWEK